VAGGSLVRKRRHADTADRTADLQGRRHRDPGGMADVAGSGRFLGAECEVRFPSFEDGTLGIPPGADGWWAGTGN
jgi:hypothetical protein